MAVTLLAVYGPILLKAAGLTIWVSWLSLLIGGFGGLLLALMRISRIRALRLCATLYVEFFRSVPILIVLFFCFYGIPLLFRIDLSAFAAATLALGLHASSMMSEVIRAGIGSVGQGQWEAARAAGMTYRQMMYHVIGPQAVQVILPPSVGIYIMVLKESSVASIIGYVELTSTGLLIRESVGGGFTILGVVALLYFLLCYSISLAGSALEHRVKIHGRGLPIDELGWATNDDRFPVLTIDGLVKRFGPRTILDGIGMTVMPGEIVCLVGPSGTGKSTLLRCINGLEDIQSGHIVFDGLRVRSHTREIIEVRKRIGMIFQQFNLYPHLTALKNVMLAPVVVHREARQAVEARARALLDRVRLSHRIDAYPNQLSGGEQQRVAIARALATQPHMLMFDEPTSALDPETVAEVLAVMRDLAEEGRTMLVVTHEMRFAADVGTRMVFFDQGKIVEQGNPKAMLANPRTERAQQFLRSIHH